MKSYYGYEFGHEMFVDMGKLNKSTDNNIVWGKLIGIKFVPSIDVKDDYEILYDIQLPNGLILRELTNEQAQKEPS